MKQNLKTISLVAVFCLLIIVGYMWGGNQQNAALSGIEKESNAYSADLTYTTTTLPLNTVNTGTLLLPRATSTRNFAEICYVSGSDVVWLYKVTASTSVHVNKGTPIFATSSANIPNTPRCVKYDTTDPYTGRVWGISSATSTVSVQHLQN